MASLHSSRLLPTLFSSSATAAVSSATGIWIPSLSLIRQSLLPFSHPLRRRKSLVRNRTILICSANSGDQEQEENNNNKKKIRGLLLQLADSFDLPSDFLSKLPRDLRLDLNDAAFDLSKGPVIDECGEELGELLLNLSRAWEQADTTASSSIISKFPSLEGSLTDNVKAAFGKRLVSAGRRFTAMGQYGRGELPQIAKAMTEIGTLLSTIQATETAKTVKPERRVLKFGDLQVELTPDKAYTGAAIAFVFGIVSWSFTQGIQSTPENNSMEFATDNALLLAKSLRGSLLTLGYTSTVLSAISSVGLLLLAQKLSSERKSKDP